MRLTAESRSRPRLSVQNIIRHRTDTAEDAPAGAPDRAARGCRHFFDCRYLLGVWAPGRVAAAGAGQAGLGCRRVHGELCQLGDGITAVDPARPTVQAGPAEHGHLRASAAAGSGWVMSCLAGLAGV